MKNKGYLVLAILSLCLFAFSGVTWAQVPSYIMWNQPPDWTLGYDIPSYYFEDEGGQAVGDDFQTDGTGYPIVDVHWWGSYQGDVNPQVPIGAPSPATNFWIGFWSDVPVDDSENELGYSYPGMFLKAYDSGELEGRKDGYQEWSERNGYYYEVEFSDDPLYLSPNTTYWVSILAMDDESWGWKTSSTHWNDDAIVAYLPPDTEEPIPGVTKLFDIAELEELRHPQGHPYEGESVDMAFKVTAAPEPISSILFATGGATLAFRRYWKRRR